MGRSVSTPSNATAIAYSWIDDDDGDTDFDYVIDDFRETVRSLFPSARRADSWIGRENHVLMENGHAQFGVSEYCGCVAYWMVPTEDSPLAAAWCERAAIKFEAAFGTTTRWRWA